MEKVLKEYKKTHTAVRRLGRMIRKLETKHNARLLAAREATLQAKADSAAYATRMKEVLDAQAARLGEASDDSSAGIDQEESDRIATSILGVFPECSVDGCDKGAGDQYRCVTKDCGEFICNSCWQTGQYYCDGHATSGMCACGQLTKGECDMVNCDAPVCDVCRAGDRRFCPPHALEAKG